MNELPEILAELRLLSEQIHRLSAIIVYAGKLANTATFPAPNSKTLEKLVTQALSEAREAEEMIAAASKERPDA